MTSDDPLSIAQLLLQNGSIEPCLAKLKQAERQWPENPEIQTTRALAYRALRRYAEALAAAERAISIAPGFAGAHSIHGIILLETEQTSGALDAFNRAIALDPTFTAAHSNRGLALRRLKRLPEAIRAFEAALRIDRTYATAYANLGLTLKELDRPAEAVGALDRALALKPDYAEAWSHRAGALYDQRQFAAAAQSYLNAARCAPEPTFDLGMAAHQLMLLCDWTQLDGLIAEIDRRTAEGLKAAEPFGYQAMTSSESNLLTCARLYSEQLYPAVPTPPPPRHIRTGKIRLGYVCGEFKTHATSILLVNIWERHDRSKFELHAFDNGVDDGSTYRTRIVRAFDKIHSIRDLSDADAAALVRAEEIDILINLNGFYGAYRQGLFALKPAPVQVNYLGFPGTLGAPYMDYIIADRITIPESSQRFYTEKVVYLPNCYQPNDPLRRISDRVFTRADFGLPEHAMVYCCFNNCYKLTPAMFTIWMRILQAVDGSVLWLLVDEPQAERNLRREATNRGVDPSRLVFARRLPLDEHLARHRLADLFLDTLPYNAHTTASDALWAGLPVLTVVGNTFPDELGQAC